MLPTSTATASVVAIIRIIFARQVGATQLPVAMVPQTSIPAANGAPGLNCREKSTEGLLLSLSIMITYLVHVCLRSTARLAIDELVDEN